MMGSVDEYSNPFDGEGPIREVVLRPFAMSSTAVTNKAFKRFVEETGYVTDAEREGWSFVFHLLIPSDQREKIDKVAAAAPWWLQVPGSCWHRPEGPQSNIASRDDHPVVHVSWNDAQAFCAWVDQRLPTEAEWEFAARGGMEGARYPWGNDLMPDGRHLCNIWQGRFPRENTVEDGWLSTAPVRTYEPNEFGLYNTVGNVWEWCDDWFDESKQAKAMRGGSYLCHASYCNRYRVSARSQNTPNSSAGNIGFRCAA
jgi:formylglycine-generating enzyme required for sulfatase activity